MVKSTMLSGRGLCPNSGTMRKHVHKMHWQSRKALVGHHMHEHRRAYLGFMMAICRHPVGSFSFSLVRVPEALATLRSFLIITRSRRDAHRSRRRFLPHSTSSSSSSFSRLLAPGLLLLCLPAFLPLLPPPDCPLLGGGRTKAKSTLIVCSSNCSPFAPSIAALASERVGYSMSTYP